MSQGPLGLLLDGLINRVVFELDITQVQQGTADFTPDSGTVMVLEIQKSCYAVGGIVGGTLQAVLLNQLFGRAVNVQV